MPKDHTDYLMTEIECLEAIEAFKKTTSVPDWLLNYKQLYTGITIAPEGLPEIIDANFESESFEGIKKFGWLYKTVCSIF
jgi:hypothetical protein